jgi:hypothetical protein
LLRFTCGPVGFLLNECLPLSDISRGVLEILSWEVFPGFFEKLVQFALLARPPCRSLGLARGGPDRSNQKRDQQSNRSLENSTFHHHPSSDFLF